MRGSSRLSRRCSRDACQQMHPPALPPPTKSARGAKGQKRGIRGGGEGLAAGRVCTPYARCTYDLLHLAASSIKASSKCMYVCICMAGRRSPSLGPIVQIWCQNRAWHRASTGCMWQTFFCCSRSCICTSYKHPFASSAGCFGAVFRTPLTCKIGTRGQKKCLSNHRGECLQRHSAMKHC